MIIIKVLKNKQIVNQASFQTEEEADLWLNKEIKNKSFGELGSYQIKVEYT